MCVHLTSFCKWLDSTDHQKVFSCCGREGNGYVFSCFEGVGAGVTAAYSVPWVLMMLVALVHLQRYGDHSTYRNVGMQL